MDTLYIMGDLFDFWLGFPSRPFTQYEPVLDALERLVLNGCRLVYFEGNHDFHLGPLFSEHLQAEIHTEPAITVIQGKRLYLCHGDQINVKDRQYRLLRFLLRSPAVAAGVGYVPPSWAQLIRMLLQKRSRSGYRVSAARWDYRRIIQNFACHIQQQGCDGLITGHFHLAMCENLPGSDFTVLSLGDWIGQSTYGEMRNGKLSLSIWPDTVTAP